MRKNIIIEELYKLETTPILKDKKYIFKIIEFEKEYSHFYGFELIKIIHPKETNIGVVNNKIVAYKNLILPTSILDSQKNDWTKKLSDLNNKTFFSGEKKDILNIKFDNIQNLKNIHLLFKAGLRANYSRITQIAKKLEKISFSEKEWTNSLKKIATVSLGAIVAGETMKAESVFAANHLCKSINIYADISFNNKKQLINIIHPREKSSFGLVDISQYKQKKSESFSLKLKWTNSHNLNFLGAAEVDSLNSLDIKQEIVKLSSLKHSESKEVHKKDLGSKGIELIPGQFINLEFLSKKEHLNPDQKVSFIFKSKGYYTPF